jgi:hypothetical protein
VSQDQVARELADHLNGYFCVALGKKSQTIT